MRSRLHVRVQLLTLLPAAFYKAVWAGRSSFKVQPAPRLCEFCSGQRCRIKAIGVGGAYRTMLVLGVPRLPHQCDPDRKCAFTDVASCQTPSIMPSGLREFSSKCSQRLYIASFGRGSIVALKRSALDTCKRPRIKAMRVEHLHAAMWCCASQRRRINATQIARARSWILPAPSLVSFRLA